MAGIADIEKPHGYAARYGQLGFSSLAKEVAASQNTLYGKSSRIELDAIWLGLNLKTQKNKVKKSGKYFRDNPKEDFNQTTSGQENLQVLSNWRDVHGAVLNTAQAWIRRLDRSTDIIVAQRLKRFDTVLDKLVTGRSSDLSIMHDIAGVRVIFESEDDLRNFRKKWKNPVLFVVRVFGTKCVLN